MVSAGLLGSAHCIGMCGALVAVASDGASGARRRIQVQLGYQLARLTSYVTWAWSRASLGRALDLAGQAAGLGKGGRGAGRRHDEPVGYGGHSQWALP